MTGLLDRIVVPVADPDDAAATCRSLRQHDLGDVLALYVVEKAGGAPDKASVEQREEFAAEIFEVVESTLAGADARSLETEIAYGTDVAEAIFDVAEEFDATAIAMSPRGGSRWIRLLTGDVALSLITDTDRPVVVLPDADERDADESTEEPAGSDDGDSPADADGRGPGDGGSGDG